METVHDRGAADGSPGAGVRPRPEPGGEQAGRVRWPQFAGAAAVLAVGVAAVASALNLGYWDRGPGPGFFPLWTGVLLIGLALAWAVQTYLRKALPRQDRPPAGSRRQVLLVVVGFAAVVVLLDVIGYQLTMFLFVLYLLLVVCRRRLLESLTFAVVGGVGVYALFANVLQVYLPTASLSFLAQLGL